MSELLVIDWPWIKTNVRNRDCGFDLITGAWMQFLYHVKMRGKGHNSGRCGCM